MATAQNGKLPKPPKERDAASADAPDRAGKKRTGTQPVTCMVSSAVVLSAVVVFLC